MKSFDGFRLGAVALVFVAFFAPWIGLPFEVRQSGVDYLASSVQAHAALGVYAIVMAVSLLLFTLSVYFSKPVLTVIFSALALSFCGVVFAHLVAKDGVALATYIDEIEDYRIIKHFFKSYFAPNNGYSLVVPSGSLFDGLINRFRAVFSILEWGWFLFAGGCLGVYLTALFRASLLVALSSVLIVVVPFVLTTFNVLQGAKYQHQAQQSIARGDLPTAYDEMLMAFESDPMLKYSTRSTELLSQLIGRVYSKEKPSAAIYRAATLESLGQRTEALEALKSALENASGDDHFRLLDYRTKRQLVALVDKLVRRHYRHEHYGKALQLVTESLHVYPDSRALKTLTSLSYLKQNLPAQCVAAVNEVLADIHSNHLVADLLSTRGECLLLQGAASEARQSFLQSIDIDGTRNLRAVRGLSGT